MVEILCALLCRLTDTLCYTACMDKGELRVHAMSVPALISDRTATMPADPNGGSEPAEGIIGPKNWTTGSGGKKRYTTQPVEGQINVQATPSV